ncbi:MAG: ubiquinone/menaquinone biosynthesis methyltransferase [Parachlamydiales bacterium]
MLSYKGRTGEGVRTLFGEIAERYDRNNALLSFGMFKRWNRALIASLPKGATLLDLCAGTGEIAFAHSRRSPAELILLDFCPEMLEIAKRKGGEGPTYLCADAHTLPLEGERVEAVSCAYGIRNLVDPVQCGREVYRVLKPGGIFSILELTRPRNPLLARLHSLHVRLMVPLLGRLFSPSRAAYAYLSESVRTFTDPYRLAEQLEQVGFSTARIKPLDGGAATLITLTK